MVDYPDQQHLERVLAKINALPPLVTPAEVGAQSEPLLPAAVPYRDCFLDRAPSFSVSCRATERGLLTPCRRLRRKF